MAESKDMPISVKVEEHSQSVVLTYFQGDIGSEVDAHFSRALNKTQTAKASAVKSGNKRRKSVKAEDSSSCQWTADPSTSYTEASFLPLSGRLVTAGHAKEGHHTAAALPFGSTGISPAPWTAGGLGLPPISYSLNPEGLGMTGQQYATSLLNLLHSDRAEAGASVTSAATSAAKPELLASWAAPAGFRDPLDPAVGFESGRSLDKKDLYWY